MNKIAIAGIAAVGLLVVGGLSYTIGNFAGRPTQTAYGRIDDVDYKPRHRCGTKTVNEKSVPKYCDARWRVEIAYQGEYEIQNRSTRPPAWMREGAQVRVRYVTGRWNRGTMFTGVDRG